MSESTPLHKQPQSGIEPIRFKTGDNFLACAHDIGQLSYILGEFWKKSPLQYSDGTQLRYQNWNESFDLTACRFNSSLLLCRVDASNNVLSCMPHISIEGTHEHLATLTMQWCISFHGDLVSLPYFCDTLEGIAIAIRDSILWRIDEKAVRWRFASSPHYLDALRRRLIQVPWRNTLKTVANPPDLKSKPKRHKPGLANLELQNKLGRHAAFLERIVNSSLTQFDERVQSRWNETLGNYEDLGEHQQSREQDSPTIQLVDHIAPKSALSDVQSPSTSEERSQASALNEIIALSSDSQPISRRGMSEKRVRRAKLFRSIKDTNPNWSQAKVAMEANNPKRELKSWHGKEATADDVDNDYRDMGWEWLRSDRIR